MKAFLLLIFTASLMWSNDTKSQSIPQLLKSKDTRDQIFTAIIKDSTMMAEFMKAMKKDSSCCDKLSMMKMKCDSSMMQSKMSDHKMMMHNMSNESEMESPSDTVVYTCTMHPEIELPKPGKCPKCGMELVRKIKAKKSPDKMKMDQ